MKLILFIISLQFNKIKSEKLQLKRIVVKSIEILINLVLIKLNTITLKLFEV